ncbi:MAG: sporulation protein YunB [Clostridiaceae bacterium]|nr:sporulation protein YunB [Clostridiaceae bacterium]
MRRKTNLHHRLWYVGRNRRRIYFCLTLAVIIMVFLVLMCFIEKRMRTSLDEFSQYRTKALITGIVSDAVNKNFPDSLIYEEIVIVNRDSSDRITSVQTNIAMLNRIFSNVSSDIQKELSSLKNEKITIPLGSILGNSMLAAEGPEVGVKIIPAGSVETDFKSEFTSAGINQTNHRIYMTVKTNVGIVIPFVQNKSEITTNIPIAETVIVGEVPEFYMKR